jgi:hypothetical protein
MRVYRIFLIICLLLCTSIFAIGQKYSTPQKTFEIYKEAAKVGDANVYLECITQASRELLADQFPSKDILQQEYQFLKEKEYSVKQTENTAVLYFKENTEYEPPYLFIRENDEWKIDLKGMEEKIYFDKDKKWYILGEKQIVLPEEEPNTSNAIPREK